MRFGRCVDGHVPNNRPCYRRSPNCSIGRTFRIAFDFVRRPQRRAKAARKWKQYRNPVALALEWQSQLDGDGHGSRSRLARKLGVSRARVSQVLSLLKLSPTAKRLCIQLDDPAPVRVVNERKLRSLADLSPEQQVNMISDWLHKFRLQMR